MSTSQTMGVHLPLSPEMRRMVERYHRNEIAIEKLDDAFMSIVSNEAALDYLASLDQQHSKALEPLPVTACAPVDGASFAEISAAAIPAPGLKCAPATVPMSLAETLPAVQQSVVGGSTLETSSSVAPKPPGIVLRAFACITLGVLVGVVYWFQPQSKSMARTMQQPHHNGMSAN